MQHQQSLISAHHNYFVNNALSPGFVLGDPNSEDDFYFLADLVLPGESTPRISARLFDAEGRPVLELRWNRIAENPGSCSYQSLPGGFRITCPTGEPVLSVETQRFANGYLTRIQGNLHDRQGNIRMEPCYEDIRVHGECRLALDAPFCFAK